MPEPDPTHEFTRLMQVAFSTDRAANDRLFELVYDQLKKIAQQLMTGERAEHTLQATALVSEAYLRLAGDGAARWQNRGHFFFAAAEAMRRILIDHARKRGRVKRGGGAKPIAGVLDLASDD